MTYQDSMYDTRRATKNVPREDVSTAITPVPTNTQRHSHRHHHRDSPHHHSVVTKPEARKVEHYTNVNPENGARTFYAKDEQTGAQARGYYYNSNDDPAFQRRHGGDGSSRCFVQQQVFTYSSGDAGTPLLHRRPHEWGHHQPVVVEAVDEADNVQDGFADKYAQESQQRTAPRTPGGAHDAPKQPVVEEPDDDGHYPQSQPRGFKDRNLPQVYPRSRVGAETHELSPFVHPLASMHEDIFRMHNNMMAHMQQMMSMSLGVRGGRGADLFGFPSFYSDYAEIPVQQQQQQARGYQRGRGDVDFFGFPAFPSLFDDPFFATGGLWGRRM